MEIELTRQKPFGIEYYQHLYKKSILHQRGDKPFFYPWWIRFLKKQWKLGKDKRIFDYGCGEGFWLKSASRYMEAYGGDISEYAIKATKRNSKDVKEVILIKNNIIPYENDFFDVVTIFDVIEHVKEPGAILSEAYRVLKNNGIALISTPNLLSWGRKFKKENWHGVKDFTHINMKTIDSWIVLFKNHKFQVVKYGTDLFWDYPYFKFIPSIIQKIFFVGINNALFLIRGFSSFKYGENAYFILKK